MKAYNTKVLKFRNMDKRYPEKAVKDKKKYKNRVNKYDVKS